MGFESVNVEFKVDEACRYFTEPHCRSRPAKVTLPLEVRPQLIHKMPLLTCAFLYRSSRNIPERGRDFKLSELQPSQANPTH